jgi:Domain of unknown function (DUF1707)
VTSGDNVPPWFYGYSRRRDVDDVASSQIRCSDAERQEMVDKLSKHFADGRLDEVEFDDRMGKAMAAKTRGNLAGLLNDLPPLAGEARAKVPTERRRRSGVLFALGVFFFLFASSWAWNSWEWRGWALGPHLGFILIVILAVVLLRRIGWHRHARGFSQEPPGGP